MRRGDCSWTRKHKWRYLDKTLPAPLRRQVEAHLAVCIPCRAEFALAQDALEALAAGKPLTPEQQRALQPPAKRLSLSKVAAVAILALLTGVGVYLWRAGGDALLARLNARGTNEAVQATPAPAALPEPNLPAPPIREVETTTLATPEPKPIEVVPQSVEAKAQPEPPQASTQQRAQPAPRRRLASPKPNPQTVTPAEGTVEVYDEAGNLIKREQVKEKQ